MKKNLYKKFQKGNKKKEKCGEEYVEKSKTLKIILSFICDFIGKVIKLIYYICIVALCSLGATFLFNYLLKGGFIW